MTKNLQMQVDQFGTVSEFLSSLESFVKLYGIDQDGALHSSLLSMPSEDIECQEYEFV